METLQNNKLIRSKTYTPVRYRVTEIEGTKRKGDKTDEIVVGIVHRQDTRDNS